MRIEIDPYRFDSAQPFKIEMEYRGAPPVARWFDENEKSLEAKFISENGKATAQIPQQKSPPTHLEIVTPTGAALDLQKVRFDYSLPVGGETPQRIDMTPRVFPAKGKPIQRSPKATLSANSFVLQNSTLVARFETEPKFRLVSLRNEYLQKNVLTHPEATQLFLIETGGKRYGAKDWQVRGVKAT